MKKKVFHIDIQIPCNENWQKMTATERGAFCMHCKKEVIDFTEKTPVEIAQYIAKKEGKSCGRFNSEQLNKIYTYYEPKKQNNLKYAAGLVLGMLVAENGTAQNEIKKEKIEISEVKNTSNNNSTDDTIVVKGYVKDINGEPLIGVDIYESNIVNYAKGTVSDIDGKFELRVKKRLLQYPLIISYAGYKSDTIQVTSETNQYYIIQLKSNELTETEFVGFVGVITVTPNYDPVYSSFPNNNIFHKKKKKKAN